ncbi:MAG TPA: AAA family ATPase [Selenomonas sp.]|nr:ATP-binding protein [Selenomonadaceae bacterium]MDD6120973.1 ATP-binding protein [Selenomonadaceae bacterium]MDD7056128.1 ATP-binding protein [Selenomonadaceae bacterium]MDY3917084.1 ATP-binding protein [Selenomonadaceae bacterium]HBT80211.1 AAA family ATPase [Selenomonas sp.]
MQIPRDIYLKKLINRMHNGMIKVITGIRRSGKSYLLLKLFRSHLLASGVPEDHIIVMEFDRRENKPYCDPDRFLAYLHAHMQDAGSYYVLLDEVQNLQDFESVLNSLLYEENVDAYVTGSNSRFLSTDVITEFRGRGDEVHVYPLSFREFMTAYKGETYRGWQEYLLYGGLPFTVTRQTDEEKSEYLQHLFRETYLKDIIERNHLEKHQELEDLLNVLASSIGSLTNAPKIVATFKSRLGSSISINTVKSYIGYLQEAFLIQEAKRYDVKGRKYIGTPVKYYFEDVGLRNALLNFRQVEETHLMENIVYNELRLRGYHVDVGNVSQRVYNPETGARTVKHLEVDFVANLGSKRYYIQSAYAIPDEEKRQQEKASLLALKDSFKKIIVVNGFVPTTHDDDGILTIGLLDFLLDTDSLDR